MRILWIKVGGLWPVDCGGRRRSFEILSALALRHRVVVALAQAPGEDPRPLREALAHCEAVHVVPHAIPKAGSARFLAALARSWLSAEPVDIWKCRVPALRALVRSLFAAGHIDVCVVDFLAAMENVPALVGAPILLFEHNVEHLIWKRLRDAETRPLRRALLELEWRKMRRFEARACARASRTVAVSEDERRLLAALSPSARVAGVPTGVDTSYFAPRDTAERNGSLVFTGAMDWYPNEEGVLHFLAETLPRVRAQAPGASLAIVGRNPSAALQAAALEAGAHVTGTVDDVRPHIAEAQVYVVPLRIGGGTRLKIFEALAMGKAVVSTRIGAEGLPLTPGVHFLLADDPASFASAVCALLADPERRRALGAAGRRLVEEHFSWQQVAQRFEAELAEVMSHAR